jgi:hypothetical protein
VLTRQDPGVPNWLDPVCWDAGIILLRWYRAARDPLVVTRKVPYSQLREHLPADTATVTPEQRRDEIERRRRACRRWYGYEPRHVHGL